MRENAGEKTEAFEIDIKKLLLAYLSRWWIIALCGVIVASVALLYSVKGITPLYQASTTIYVNNTKNNQNAEYVNATDLTTSERLVTTYITIAKSTRVLQEVQEYLNDQYTVEELKRWITASQVGETEIFEVQVLHPDPVESQRIANAVARVVPQELAELIEGSSAWVIDYAKLPEQRHSPSYSKNTLVGGMVGCVIAAAVLTIQFILDIRIKEEDDLTELFEYPILGHIPDFARTGKGKAYRNQYNRYAYQNGYASPTAEKKEENT